MDEELEIIESERQETQDLTEPGDGELSASYESYIETGRPSVERFLSFAGMLESAGFNEQAVDAFTRALVLDHRICEALRGRARVLSSIYIASYLAGSEDTRLIRRSVADLRSAYAAGCFEKNSLREYALALLLAGDYEECIRLIRDAPVSMEKNETGDRLYLLGFAELFSVSEGGSSVAEREFEKLLEDGSFDGEAWFGMAICSIVSGQASRLLSVVEMLQGLDARLARVASSLSARGVSSYLEVAAVYFGEQV